MGKTKKYVIYTDGSCNPNPGNGGYAAIITPYVDNEQDGEEIIVRGNQPKTTNNKMEMKAVIKALETIDERSVIEIHSDSEYVVKAFTEERLKKWIAKGWKNSSRKLVPNKDLWLQLLQEIERVSIGDPTFIFVPRKNNTRCDKMAKEEANKLPTMNEEINAPLYEAMGFDDEGLLDFIEHLDMTYSEFVDSFYSEGYGWNVKAISELWDALNRPYADIAAEWGFDDENGEPQEPI